MPAAAVFLYAQLPGGASGSDHAIPIFMLAALMLVVWLTLKRFVLSPLSQLYDWLDAADDIFDAYARIDPANLTRWDDIVDRFNLLITRTQASQQVLQENEERLQLALLTNNQGLYDLDIKTGEVTVNPAYATILGYPFEGFRETDTSWRERLHPEDRAMVGTIYRDYIAGVRPDYQVEFRLRSADGTYRWISSVGAIVARDDQGRPLRMLGTHLDITQRKEAELRQQESDQRLSFALEAAGIGDWNMDLRTNVAYRSLQHDRCFGYQEAVPHWGYDTFLAHVHELDRERVNEAFQRALGGLGNYDVEFRVVWPDGSIHWLLSKGRFYFDDTKTPYRVAGIQVDVTAHKNATTAAADSENRYHLLFQNSMDGVLQTTSAGEVIAANTTACTMLGLNEEEIRRRSFEELVDTSVPRLPALLAKRSQTGSVNGELFMVRGDGSRFEVEISSRTYKDQADQTYASIIIRDITQRREAEAEIHKLAFFDSLTGLPNRRLLMDRLGEALSDGPGVNNLAALLFIDLDHFKYINDARGHGVGDAVLQRIGARLSALLREEDLLSRIGGDEFVVLLKNLGLDLDDATRIAQATAEKIRDELVLPVRIENQEYIVSGSIGVTLLPRFGSTADDLLREADTAMYRAKATGRNRVAFFEMSMQDEVEERLSIERDLALAIAAGQLEMFMQPQVNADCKTVGAELLMRWNHPVRGVIPPAVFIPVAEESGLILQLGTWTLHQGCQALVSLASAGHDLSLSINVSPYQFRQADFVQQVERAIDQSSADATKLIFEITEGLLIENVEQTIDRMREIAALGIRFSIDDFGTGYSSLSYLKRLPLFEVKIDKSFIQDIHDNSDDTAIVQSIISMAKLLRLRVVAEGVETRQQADFLIKSQCQVFQGYLYDKPMPISAWLYRQAGCRDVLLH
ncbi:sensor domain-containing protein [Massilia soli]|uniref:EAL domain-containing protein n=1 Tax=Massilia soli TaxID=2792854 RepID=A0ABS7SMR9_9BURK|nr:EAL domain-containing protein [Massilia soli]MBZ2206598.1 EAL domain-containing protein [Massilia soli]